MDNREPTASIVRQFSIANSIFLCMASADEYRGSSSVKKHVCATGKNLSHTCKLSGDESVTCMRRLNDAECSDILNASFPKPTYGKHQKNR